MVISICKKGNYTYVLSKTAIMSEKPETVIVYGISIIGKEQRASIDDISDNYSFVKCLFDLLVDEELYPEHLYDVVDDYLSDGFSVIIPFKRRYENTFIA